MVEGERTGRMVVLLRCERWHLHEVLIMVRGGKVCKSEVHLCAMWNFVTVQPVVAF